MESATTVDGIAAQPPAKKSSVPRRTSQQEVQVKRWKVIISAVTGTLYVLFMAWCAILLAMLPAAGATMKTLTMIGVVTSVMGGIVFIMAGISLLMHIGRAKTGIQARKFALIKLCVAVIPGLTISIVTPLMIMREPTLLIDITYPTSADEMVAPVSMTFNVQNAVDILLERNFRPLKYRWDVTGDAKVDSETFNPELTATYDHEGVFLISVTIVGSDGTTKIARKRLVIRQAVFSVTPTVPIVEKPVVFGLSHLLPEDVEILSAEWDFDGDDKIDETSQETQVSYTYYKTGKYTPTVSVTLSNNTKFAYQRPIDVQDPPSLPFPVKIETEPNNLLGTAPFTALFKIETSEPVSHVQWSFGDGTKGEGMRVAHTFNAKGSFPVQAKVRSENGITAEVSTVVDIVQKLELNDLVFEGTPKVEGNKIEGEVPVTINLKPITNKTFIQFFWEAPNATEVGSTQDTLQAIYRREGTYTVTLIGTDAENRVLRLPITVVVRPASSILSFKMDPESGVAPMTVKFDASETTIPGDDITGFIWGFGDTSTKEYGGAFTQHTYTSARTYVVDLTVTTAKGKQESITRTLVVRAPVMQSCIMPSRTKGQAPFGVEFKSSCSTGDITRYLWDFGDGSQTDEQNPIHVFEKSGTFIVRLTIYDSIGASHSSTVTITAE